MSLILALVFAAIVIWSMLPQKNKVDQTILKILDGGIPQHNRRATDPK